MSFTEEDKTATNSLVEKADGIATIMLHHPEKRNPLNEQMLREV